MMDLKESDFLDRLQTSLGNQGIPSERDFHLPGRTHRIDLYLPQLPRASVEIKSIPNPEQLASAMVETATKHETLREELGVTFKTFLVLLHPSDRKPEREQKTPDGVMCLYVKVDLDTEKLVEEVAVKIKESIKIWRITHYLPMFGVTGIGVAGAVVAGLMIKNAILTTAYVKETPLFQEKGNDGKKKRLLSVIVINLKKLITKKKNRSSDNSNKVLNWKTRDTGLDSSLSTSYPSGDAVRIVASQVSNILETFKELAPETHTVLAHEMQFLLEEFKLGHFTACAMRGGRSLEIMVYELSRRWGIDIQDATFGKLDELRKTLDRIGDLIGDYQVSANEQRKTLGEELEKALISLNANSMSLALAVKGEQQIQLSNTEIAPRPVVSLLKKIQKRYGHLDGTGENIRSLFVKDPGSQDGSLIARIIRIRNRAAHANTQGEMQEIDEASVRKLIDDINVMLLRLSNVGIAIQNYRPDGIVDDDATVVIPSSS